MHIALLTYGSQGDVQPFVALARGLQHAGHTVVLAAPRRFAAFCAQHGVPCEPLAGDPEDLSRTFNTAGGNTWHMVRGMYRHVAGIAAEVMQGVRRAIRGADQLVHSFAFTVGAHSLARELGIPDVSVQLFPVFAPTRAFASPVVQASLPGWLNAFSHRWFEWVFWHAGNLGYHQLRRHAPRAFPAQVYWPFAASRQRARTPLLFAFSPAVVPTPPEWRAPGIHQVGYFFLDAAHEPPASALSRFLAAGDPPVCITFGSMINRATATLTQAALTASARLGYRALVITGWGGEQPAHVPEQTLFVESAPHTWLFPQCQAVMHHGGAGTSAAGLRAGLPTLVVPHTADQFFWGQRVAALGVGPRPLAVRQANAETLTEALAAATTPVIRQRAAVLGHQVRAERGVEQAVGIISAC